MSDHAKYNGDDNDDDYFLGEECKPIIFNKTK